MSEKKIARYSAPYSEGSPWLEDTHDNEPSECDREVVLMWAEDYDAMMKEVEEGRALKERTKNAWTEAIRKIREGAKK
jgi:hypothetical protein